MNRAVLSVFLLTLSLALAAAEPTDAIRVNDLGVGLDGYSPVSYFSSGEPELGDPAYASSYKGVNYWFTSGEQLAQFEADPERFLPAHGGWCTLMMAGSGRRTPGHPESFAIVDDRLMLFWSGDTDDTKGMGLSNWESKTGGSAIRASAVARDADENWAEFLRGERRARVWLYKRSDNQAVSATQRENAREQYID